MSLVSGRVRVAGLALLAAIACAAPAAAQEQGVHIDPDSPSAKEYRIPLESERRQADPRREPSAEIVQGARSSPIFGAGIVAGGSTGDRPARPRARERQAGDAQIVQAAISNPGPPAAGAGGPLEIGGVAAGVLLLGGLAGLLLRRRRA